MPRPTGLLGSSSILGSLALFIAATACQHLSPDPSAQLSPAQEAAATDRANERGPDGVNILSGREIENMRFQRFEQMLEGRFPGVRVVKRANGDYSVRIRGAGSFVGTGDPLFLLDGMEIAASSLRNINPAEVERIQVIKDGTAAAYGILGANGVILITTIRPD